MKAITASFFILAGFVLSSLTADELQLQKPTATNLQIDFPAFVAESQEVAKYREDRRVDVETFLRMLKEKDTMILDTRSAASYRAKHLKGAVHLNFSDITKESLAKAIPSKDTRILIYCNNNFTNNSPSFALKSAPAALNIPTFITLYNYGYRNIYELGVAVDENKTILPFEGTEK